MLTKVMMMSAVMGAVVAHARPSQRVERPAQTTLKVFVLAGQSNTVGMAEVATVNTSSATKDYKNGTLAYQLKDPRTAAQFAPLWDKSTSNWTVLSNVAMWYNEVGPLGKNGTMVNGSKIPGVNGVDACFGPLSVGFGAGCGANNRNNIGPELGFGFGMQDALAPGEKFMIMKVAWGGKTLSGDFRPPTSTTTFDPFCVNQTAGSPCKTVGHYYQVMMDNVAKMMVPGAIGQMYPELASMTPEIAGFGWWQGWNDGCDLNSTASYEQNMVNMVKDIRSAWNNSKLPVSIATAGFMDPSESVLEATGRTPKTSAAWIDLDPAGKIGSNCPNDRGCRRLDVILSQIAAANATRHPELGGNVITMNQLPYHREPEFSPAPGQGYHYFHNAETYYLTGLAMAKGMASIM